MQVMGKNVIGTIAYMGGVMTVPEQFCWSFSQMVQYNTEYLCNPGEIVHYERATVSYHSYARNTIVDRIRGDWLLMLDTDHMFDPDICARLLSQVNQYDIDVLCGIYQYKSAPHSPVIYKWNEKKDGFELIGDWEKQDKTYFLPIASAGAGCLFVKKSVFNRIKRELGEGAFDIIPPFSEDHSFFKRLDKIGIQAYCSPNIECHHLQVRPLSLKDYKIEDVKLSERIEV